MLKNYYPIYQITLELGSQRATANTFKLIASVSVGADAALFRKLLESIIRECPKHGLTNTSEMAERLIGNPLHDTHTGLLSDLDHLEWSLGNELKKESVFRIPPERKGYFEHAELFGPEVARAFPSCERDIRKAGSCYALEQEDACVHHLMLVLERGLNVLAAKVQVPYQRINWQVIIDQIGAKLRSAPRGPERDFLVEVNAQFGFLKDAYRNHSEHARDEHYDMEKALSILKHVRGFMQALEKGGLSE